ncbi:DNA cytosine methyltransferase [Rossellomorea aquimaris]|uniref:DNA cytosine methyltransferase n=1 Tax=Rossellomorea aquimaris TaxID=189382 RepID=UPI0009E4F2B9|nr:DNA cytosine methyltransferase [Rossellomorea aquimaris]
MKHFTFTPYEAQLLQSFPKDYAFFGGRNAQYRQIGNAVPPLLGKVIGEAILKLEAVKGRRTGNLPIAFLISLCFLTLLTK